MIRDCPAKFNISFNNRVTSLQNDAANNKGLFMTSVNSVSPSAVNYNAINGNAALSSNSNPAGNADLIATATNGSPMDAGNALRQLDGMTGSKVGTNAALQDGTKIAGRDIDCKNIPDGMGMATTSVGGSAFLFVGGSAAVGSFSTLNKQYSGNFATFGGGVGLGAGGSVNAGITNTSDFSGSSIDLGASFPGVSGSVGLGSTDGTLRITGANLGPGAKIGVTAQATETIPFWCKQHY
jgi:hypothetical protein